MPASSGATPCSAAAARAMRHSKSLQRGGWLPGCSSSAANSSVAWRSASSTRGNGGSAVNSHCQRGAGARRGVVVAPIALLAGYQVVPAPPHRQPGSDFAMFVTRRVQVPVVHLIVQQITHCAIKLRRVRSMEHHLQIVALLPVSLGSELRFDLLVERRAG